MAETLTLPNSNSLYAIGLTWRHEDAIPKAKTLRSLAAGLGSWGAVCRTSAGHVQAGFCEPLPGVVPAAKVRPLAATVADAIRAPWLGLFDLEDGRYWLVAVRDGNAIIPDGDVVGTRDQLERIRMRHRELPGWTEEPEGGLADIARLVDTGIQQPVLRDLLASRLKPVLYATFALLMGAAAIGAYTAWRIHQQHLEQEAQELRARVLALAVQAKNGASLNIKPWTQAPMPSQVIAACADAWAGQPIARAGWTLAQWGCSADVHGMTIDVTWSALGGLASDAPGTLSADAKSSTQSYAVERQFPAAASDVQDDVAARRAAWTFAQTHAMSLDLKQSALPVSLPGATAQPSQVPLPDSLSAIFAMAAPPWLMDGARMDDDVPGLRIERISYDQPRDIWSVSGTVYTGLDANASLNTSVAGAVVAR